jgi:hypothetical protein
MPSLPFSLPFLPPFSPLTFLARFPTRRRHPGGSITPSFYFDSTNFGASIFAAIPDQEMAANDATALIH